MPIKTTVSRLSFARDRIAPLTVAVVSLWGLGCTGEVGGIGPGPGPGPGPGDPGPSDAGVIGTGPATGPDAIPCTPGAPPPTTRLFRLTHGQYENAIRTLTGLNVNPAGDLPADQNQAGFDRGMDLQVGDALGKAYRSAAESLAAQTVANATAYQKVVGCDPNAGDACMKTFIANFGRAAFRRPLTDAEKTAYATLFAQGNNLVDGTGTAFQKGVQTALQAFLQSPHFLYREEMSNTPAPGSSLIALGGHERAARLSFLLVNGPPDELLAQAADMGQLGTAEEIAAQARRLVALPQARQTIRDFHNQWLTVASFTNRLAKDPTKYPTVTPELAPTLLAETEQFVEAVTFDMGKGFTSLLTAPFTFVNKVTAPLYGVKGTFGDALQRADLDPSQRAGILTQLRFLAGNSYSSQSDPIHRGVFVQRQIMCANIPDPVGEIPKLPALGPSQTTREAVEMHTAPDSCKGCHTNFINPVGFAFENYDAVGQYRTTENGVTIDARGTLVATATNAPFTDAVGAAQAIAASPEARTCYARNWVRYAFGRPEATGDSCSVAALATNLASDDYKVTDLLVDMTRTSAFMFRAPGGP